MKFVSVMFATGFEEIEALAIVDILRRSGTEVKMVSIQKEVEVTGSHGITVICDTTISELNMENCEMIVLPGGMPGANNLLSSMEVKEALRKCDESEKYLSAICAAPLVLGQHGYLKSKIATCYPGFENQLLGATLSSDKVVVDGRIITSRGPGTVFEFSYVLVEILQGVEKANQLRKAMLVAE